MKAARLYKAGEPLRIDNIEIPRLEKGEVLVRIRACGVCHTDIHFAIEGLIKPGKVPQTLGHEPAGEIVEVAEDVLDYKKGDRVLIHFYWNCRACRFCLAGRESLCDNVKTFGFTIDGGYAEYAKAPAFKLVRIPDNLTFDAGILVDSGATALHAIKTVGGIRLGETVLIIGSGGVGTSLIQVAKLSGATVIAVDSIDEKLELASDLGADYTINSKKSKIFSEVMRLTAGAGADAAFETVSFKETMDDSYNSLRKGGRLVFLGYQPGVNFETHPLTLVLGEKAILGSRASSRSDLEEAVNLASQGKLKIPVTARFKLEQVNEALQMLARGEIKGRAVIEP
ncbi:MAG: alcohol dehydrogenase catalytic domain-containing protein [Nitrososphaerales archaeon]